MYYATIDIGSIISDTKENRSNLVGVALHASLLSAPTYMTFHSMPRVAKYSLFPSLATRAVGHPLHTLPLCLPRNA